MFGAADGEVWQVGSARAWDMTRGGYKGQLREFVSEAHIEIGAILIEYRVSPVQSTRPD